MKETLLKMKELFAGQWAGEGFAKFPSIDDTAYTEQLEFIPDEYKDSIFFRHKAWYKNNTEENGHTVFWDTGFILLKENSILLHSVQVAGRIEMLRLVGTTDTTFIFNSVSIENDPKAIRSRRIFEFGADTFHYELYMATHTVDFQNHLQADLVRSEF
jgi:hypothetical protein